MAEFIFLPLSLVFFYFLGQAVHFTLLSFTAALFYSSFALAHSFKKSASWIFLSCGQAVHFALLSFTAALFYSSFALAHSFKKSASWIFLSCGQAVHFALLSFTAALFYSSFALAHSFKKSAISFGFVYIQAQRAFLVRRLIPLL